MSKMRHQALEASVQYLVDKWDPIPDELADLLGVLEIKRQFSKRLKERMQNGERPERLIAYVNDYTDIVYDRAFNVASIETESRVSGVRTGE